MNDSRNLQDYSLFGFLDDAQIGRVYAMMKHESYAPGDDIITEGAPNDRVRFIISGRVAVVKEGVILSEFGEGDSFGEIEVLDTLPSEATVTALAPTDVMALSHASLRVLCREDLKTFSLILMNLSRDLCFRLRKMDQKAAQSIQGHPWAELTG